MMRFVCVTLLLLSGCTIRPFTSDASSAWQSAPVVGRCFELRLDASFHPDASSKEVEGRKHEIVRYDGFFYANPDRVGAVSGGRRAPKGSRFFVEKVYAEHLPTVGVVLKPYVRLGPEFDHALVEASGLFQFTDDSETIKPIARFLRSCD